MEDTSTNTNTDTPNDATTLEAILRQFGDKVNEHPRLRSLLAGWERVAMVTTLDTGDRFVVRFQGSLITEVSRRPSEAEAEAEGEAADACDLDIRAPEDILRGIFSGRDNPTPLFLDGTLQVFASDMDQVKLDAISLVLWD